MGKLPKPKSDFLRPEDVNDGDVVKIVGHPEVIPADQTKYGKERYVIPVALPNKNQKRWGVNLTSYRTLYKAYGDNGDNWIGQSVTVVKNREIIRGETRHVLYAEPHKEPQQELDATVPNELEQIIDREALAKLSPEQQRKLLRKLSMQQ